MTWAGWRKAKSAVFVGFCGLSIAIALVPLAFIFFFVVSEGVRALNVDFFTQMPKPVGEVGGGMANAIVGTLIIVGLGALFAIPTGIMSGVYLSEYAGTRLSSPSRLPPTRSTVCRRSSIGVFIYTIAVLPVKQFSALAGGLALGRDDDSHHRAHHRGTAAARARLDARGIARARRHPRPGHLHRRAAGRAARHPHRRGAGARPHRRRNGAAALHVVQQPLLQYHPDAADRRR
jgi:hypothetical protein